MGLGVGIFLIAVGAILKFAVHVHNSRSIDLGAVGVILMLVGAVGVALSMAFWSTWGGVGGRRRTEITESNPGSEYVPAARRTVSEERIERF